MTKFTSTERFLSLFTTLRAGEGTAAISLCWQSFALMYAYYLLKVIREPMILAEGSAELKAYTTAAQAVILMFFVVPVFAKSYKKLSSLEAKNHLFRHTLMFFGICLVTFGAAYHAGWHIGIAFYIWLGIFSVVTLALFWAFAADLFNVKAGQRIFPLIAAASALGALLGSGSASYLDQQLGHGGVMFSAAAILLLPWMLCQRVENRILPESRALETQAVSEMPDVLVAGFVMIWRNAYLLRIAAFVIVLNLINTNGEYVLASYVKSQADVVSSMANSASATGDYITQFYSRYFFLVTLLSFGIQLFLVAKIFDRIGVAGAICVLPIVMIINYSLIALIPVLAVVRSAMIFENSVNYSLGTTSRHALFLPVSRDEKYVGKHTIDTFFFRTGDVLSGGLVFLFSAVIGLGTLGFVTINIFLAVLLLIISIGIARRYRTNTRESLGNMPPILGSPLLDLSIKSGESSELQLDRNTFIDPDVGDALKYQAFLSPEERLPTWVKFDSFNRTFRFAPPSNSSGSLTIRVVARDFDGLEAQTSFTLSYSE
ncbi:MAG: Npt1/Npt2 family nucleotide transporter [Halioglobus sp.]